MKTEVAGDLFERGGQQEVVRKGGEEQRGEGEKGKKHNYIRHNDILPVVCGYAKPTGADWSLELTGKTPGLFWIGPGSHTW